MLIENLRSTDACPCDRSRSFLVKCHKSVHSVALAMLSQRSSSRCDSPTTKDRKSGLAEFPLANFLYSLTISSQFGKINLLSISNNLKTPIVPENWEKFPVMSNRLKPTAANGFVFPV